MKKALFLLFVSLTTFAQNLKSKPNWHNLDLEKDGVPGMSTEKAYLELLKNRKSSTVVVGVIDSGIDIKHEDLKDVIWVNSKEIPNNGIDDDKNGFIDDMNGWDFLGAASGEDVADEQLEKVRVYVDLKTMFGDKPKKKKIKKNKAAFKQMQDLKEEIEKEKAEAEKYMPMYTSMMDKFLKVDEVLQKTLGKATYTSEEVEKIVDADVDRSVRSAKQAFLNMSKMGVTKSDLKEAIKQTTDKVNYNLNEDFNPRKVVGDNPKALEYGKYGNNEVMGPDADHGTHVAGIIGASRSNAIGVKGIADNVKIMVLRCVPNGDERDKDVANSIRYAVDNGAQIINMSFGKSISPDKKWVDEAALYAQSKGVLIIAASGNEGQNVDEMPPFPNKITSKKERINNWISVGASSYNLDNKLIADFSNYGQRDVDVFAPGVAIYSTVPGSIYAEHDGTSMASPACVGLAALLKSYFPSLSAIEIKDIILSSVAKYDDLQVDIPGGKKEGKLTEIVLSGGIINTYNAVKLAIAKTENK